MDESSKLLLTVAIPTVTVLVGILVNNRQLDQMGRQLDQMGRQLELQGQHYDSQLTSLRGEIMQAILRVEGVLDARLKHVEDKFNIR